MLNPITQHHYWGKLSLTFICALLTASIVLTGCRATPVPAPSPPSLDAPTALPVSAHVNLAPYNSSKAEEFHNPKYLAATEGCAHASAAISLSEGQTASLTLESDCPINFYGPYPYRDKHNPDALLTVSFPQMLGMSEGTGWCIICSEAFETKHILSSDEGRRLEIMLTAHPHNSGAGIPNIYKLLVTNFDRDSSHYLKYSISSYSGTPLSLAPLPAPVPAFITTNIPTGPSIGDVNQTLTYATSADSNIAGNPEYRFDWGDGNYSSWSSSSSALYSWSIPGTYTIRAQARYDSIPSEWSSGKVVKIETQTLSRQPFGQPEQMKLYVTPDDPEVKAAVNDILSGEWRWAYNDFNTLRAWVVLNVSPMSDQEAHGVSEYWQLPAETLELGTGDCEDFAILLCTLLRAHGVPADQVYVIGGCPSEGEHGHAFLYERWYKGIWRAIEPQVDPITDTLTFEVMDWVDAVTYIRDVWCFNDKFCFQGKPALPLGVYEFEVDYSFWPATRGASVEFERHLDTRREVNGSVEWAKENQIVYNWSLYIYAPDGNTALSWSGTDLHYDFSFTPTMAGTYKVEILKRDYLARCARLTIDPPDWQ